MASNYAKRKAKEKVEASAETPDLTTAPTVNLPHNGMVVYTPDGHKYFVADLAFDPETGAARVQGVAPLTKVVGMQYKNHMVALKTLTRGRK